MIFEQLFFADRKQRTVQRGVHRQLVFGPLDGRQRRSDRVHFLALVEGLAADQQVRNAARLERLDVLARHVVAEMQEAAEQQADVSGDDLVAGRPGVLNRPLHSGDSSQRDELRDRAAAATS